MRVHDLRHTFASLMLAAGFLPCEVSRYMGHANLATSDSICAHLYPSDCSAHLEKKKCVHAADELALLFKVPGIASVVTTRPVLTSVDPIIDKFR